MKLRVFQYVLMVKMVYVPLAFGMTFPLVYWKYRPFPLFANLILEAVCSSGDDDSI